MCVYWMEQKPRGLQKQLPSEMEHDKYWKLVMCEMVLLLAWLFCTLHTSCKLFLTLPPHKSHLKDSFGLNCMKASAYSYGS